MDGQEEGSCRPEVDDGPELRGLLDWEIGRLGAPDERTSRTRRSKWTNPARAARPRRSPDRREAREWHTTRSPNSERGPLSSELL